MAWTTKQLILALTMVVTGSINTLSSSWADNTAAVGSDGGPPRDFNHPFFQAVCMFLGEMFCLGAYVSIVLYKRHQKKKLKEKVVDGQNNITETKLEETDTEKPKKKNKLPFNPLIFLPPALCDMCATSLMYIGLVMTYPSSYQMLRGSLIIFTGLLSVAFLHRTLRAYQWTGMIVVLAGLIVTGLADFLMEGDDKKDMNSVITGDLLIIIAQIIAATQMVLEERFVTKRDVPPLAAVGSEGVFGFFILGILLIPMYYIHVPGNFSTCPEHRLEDAIDAFVQIGNSWQICLATIGSIISISFFNFAGVSVTKEISATTRTVLDSIRTLVVWVVSLGVGWENFQYLQVVGYVILVIGMFIYNDIIITPFLRDHGLLPWKVCQPPVSNAAPRDEAMPVDNEESQETAIRRTSSIKGLDNPATDVQPVS